MGPEGGIEPPSGEPQSPMLPLHHSGHGYRSEFRLYNFNLLGYPWVIEKISNYGIPNSIRDKEVKSKNKRDRAYDDCNRHQFAVGVMYGMRIEPH